MGHHQAPDALDWCVQQWDRWAGRFGAAFLVLIPLSATVGPSSLNAQWSDLAAFGFLASSAVLGVWKGLGRSGLFWCAVIYVGSMLPSFVHTRHVLGSFLELTKTVYLVCLGLAITRWATTPTAWNRLIHVFAVVVMAITVLTLGVWGYAMWSGHVPEHLAVAMAVPSVGQVVRVKAGLLTPTFLANYLTMGIPILAGVAADRFHWPRATSWVILVAGLLAVGTTASHSVAGYLVAAALIAQRATRWDRCGQRCLSWLAVAAVLFSLVSTTVAVHEVRTARAPAANPPASPAEHEFLGPNGTGEELTIRVQYTWVVYALLKRFEWEAWQRHPWVGIGLEQFPDEVRQAFAMGRIHAHYAGGHDPHSTWLGAMAETGLVGLFGLLAIWIALLRRAVNAANWKRQSSESWRIRAPLAGLVGLLVNSPHVDIMHFRFLWVGVALLLAATAPKQTGS